MFCTNCGADNPAGKTFCANCGAALKAAAPQTAPQAVPQSAPVNKEPFKDNMVLAIIALVASFLCCSGGGVNGLIGLALVSSVQLIGIGLSIYGVVCGSAAQKAHAAGDDTTAAAKAKTAKNMAIIAYVLVGLGLIATIVTFILAFTLGLGLGLVQEAAMQGYFPGY